MKKTLTIIALIMLCLTACKKEEKTTLQGQLSMPSWHIDSDRDFSSSMTAIVRVDLTLTYPGYNADSTSATDLLAAFAGEQCLGATTATDSLYYLYITAPVDEQPITLLYYSASLKSIFQSIDTYAFESDARIGTTSEPLTPMFVKQK